MRPRSVHHEESDILRRCLLLRVVSFRWLVVCWWPKVPLSDHVTPKNKVYELQPLRQAYRNLREASSLVSASDYLARATSANYTISHSFRYM